MVEHQGVLAVVNKVGEARERRHHRGQSSGHRLERCDAEGIAAYLESSNVRNVPFYQRLGFQVTGSVHMPDGGPEVTFMLRSPAT